jgi:predicted dehydrogenase
MPSINKKSPERLDRKQTTARKLRVGILGSGFGANVHIPAYQTKQDVEVVALGVTQAGFERGKEIADRFGIPWVFTDYDELVTSPEVDLVSIAVPPFLHYPLTSKALKAGKHILCEKPMALNVTEAREMLRLAQETKKICMIDFEFRFLPSRQEMKKLVEDGYLGKTYCIHASMFFDYNASPTGKAWNWLSEREKGGGILGAVGSHYIDFLLWMFGDVVEICGRPETFVEYRYHLGSGKTRRVETEDSFSFICQFSSGAHGVVHFCSVANQGIGIRSGVGLAKIEAYGSDGTLILDLEDRLLGARQGKKQIEEIPIEREPYQDELPIFLQRQRRCLEQIIDEMSRGIQDGKQRSPSFVDGVRCQEVIDAIRISAEEKSWVSLPLPSSQAMVSREEQ